MTAIPHSTKQHLLRWVPLDGALLGFAPSSGKRWLLRNEETQEFQQQAPLVVLFGITNACNLQCTFCYRDRTAESVWTVASAFDLLSQLAQKGTLEVAFGGGEPFAFSGFATLLERLAKETPLALHATTNGKLLTRERIRTFRGFLQELRLSAYEDNEWEKTLRLLSEERVRVGVHWLVTPRNLSSVPEIAEKAARLGAHQLFLLSYNGNDRSMNLGREQVEELQRTVRSISELPIKIGLSACWGHRMNGVEQLMPERSGDCGAGDYFLTIGPDGSVSPCSFHHRRSRPQTVEGVLAAWREFRVREPARMLGCHRRESTEEKRHGLWMWEGYAGNNSTDCFTVGRFATAAAASKAVTELREMLRKEPQESLLDQANAVLFRAFDEALAATKNRKTVLALWQAGQEEREQWLEEVRSWENPPGVLQRYAERLGVSRESAREFSVSTEEPDLLLSFGKTACFQQGTTLRPLWVLARLWGYRGARLYLRERDTRRSWMVWAAKVASVSSAKTLAEEFSGVQRENAVFGLFDLRQPEVVRGYARYGLRINALERALLRENARFDGIALSSVLCTPDEFSSLVAGLRKKAPVVPERLLVALGGDGAQIEAEFRALAKDPSLLSEWTKQRIEGTRRWPKDLQIVSVGRALYLEGETLPAGLSRGFLLRGAGDCWSTDAREVDVEVSVYSTAEAATAPVEFAPALRTLGFSTPNPDGRTGRLSTRQPAPVLQRLDRWAKDKERGLFITLQPTNEVASALEQLQYSLKIVFSQAK